MAIETDGPDKDSCYMPRSRAYNARPLLITNLRILVLQVYRHHLYGSADNGAQRLLPTIRQWYANFLYPMSRALSERIDLSAGYRLRVLVTYPKHFVHLPTIAAFSDFRLHQFPVWQVTKNSSDGDGADNRAGRPWLLYTARHHRAGRRRERFGQESSDSQWLPVLHFSALLKQAAAPEPLLKLWRVCLSELNLSLPAAGLHERMILVKHHALHFNAVHKPYTPVASI